VVAPGQEPPAGGLAGLAATGAEVAVLAGPEAYAARRALRDLPERRVRESDSPAALKSARLALVPLSLSAGGREVPTDVPPVRVRTAVTRVGAGSPAARAFVAFLSSEAGRTAFAGCGRSE
jgi:hypothetical protein